MSLPELMEGWSNRAAVRCAAVVDEDGLLVHDMLTHGLDGEAVAALAVTAVRHLRQLGEVLGSASVRNVVVDSTAGPTILTPLDHGHTLVVIARPDLDIGPLLREIRLASPALSQAV
jgi:predicted regulator of Ras-like GTPase activity (Roadblock/LC7/MglB family)